MKQDEHAGPSQAFMFMSAQEMICMYLEHGIRGEPPAAWIVDGDATTVWRSRHG